MDKNKSGATATMDRIGEGEGNNGLTKISNLCFSGKEACATIQQKMKQACPDVDCSQEMAALEKCWSDINDNCSTLSSVCHLPFAQAITGLIPTA